MAAKKLWEMLRDAWRAFRRDDAYTLGAALAFYTSLSLTPLVILVVGVAGFLGAGTENGVVHQAEEVVGPQAGAALDAIVRNANRFREAGIIWTAVGAVLLILSATGVVQQLQHSLNVVWDVEAAPRKGLFAWFTKQLFSLAMVLTMGFLLLVSLVISAILAAVMGEATILWRAFNTGVSFVVFAALFALMFKYLPDAVIRWRDVWVGAAITAALVSIGRYEIASYLAYTGTGSSYGAAGSFVVLLTWVYYASLVFLFGAELTQAFARVYGAVIRPREHAKWRRHGERHGG